MAAAMAGPERQDGGKPLGDDGVLVVAPSSSGDTLGALQTDDDGTMALKARARLLFKIDMWLMPMVRLCPVPRNLIIRPLTRGASVRLRSS